ncbi:VOC family protein [Denitrobaculum tricleocarpae]|uniref:VOC family protein n=1 Tax=Denitrobaculum tricleocarpae TaxID=2591009 RepID=A0A545U1D8_9PROT|nr:VOC family protein [Denitrobaculum tricleocarpae]TQV83291.1 VOC family protein [Denitrobaculum tricleocarpae]
MSTGFDITGLDHVVLRITDLAVSQAFYEQVLGCSVERVQAEIGLTQLRAGRSLIDLVPVDGTLGKIGGAAPGAEGRNVDHICLAILPFDEAKLRAHLEAHGVEILDEGLRYGAEGKGPSFYIQDPDGNTVELKGPAIPE